MNGRAYLSGFTLIELIIVLILISIMSVYAATRFVGVSQFSTYALQEQAVSVIRAIKLHRMQSNMDLDNATSDTKSYFNLLVSGSCLGTQFACTSSQDDSNKIIADHITFSAKVELNPSYTGSLPHVRASTFTSNKFVNFDLLGNPTNASGQALNASEMIDIKIQDTSSSQVCHVWINSQGYVSQGSCS